MCARLFIVAALFVSIVSSVAPLSGAVAQVTGTIYVSPTFGYTITWELPWYVTNEDADDDGLNRLSLADSRSQVLFTGGMAKGHPASDWLQTMIDYYETSAEYRNVQQVEGSGCASDESNSITASYCLRADISDQYGADAAIGIYLQARVLDDDTILLTDASTEESILQGYLPHWQGFGIFKKGVAIPESAQGCAVETIGRAQLCFDTSLTPEDRDDIGEGIHLAQNVVDSIIGKSAISDLQVTGLASIAPDGEEQLAEARGTSIAVYTGSSVWKAFPRLRRVETIVHEYFHIVQHALTGLDPGLTPQWFVEGSAESFGNSIVSQIGISDQGEIDSQYLYTLTQSPVLSDLPGLGVVVPMGADEYALAYIAMQYLLGSRGLSVESLIRVFQEIGTDSTFDEAFSSVFGMMPVQFYAEFDGWRANMLKVTQPEDDFLPNNGPTSGAAVNWKYTPQQVAPGDQLMLSAWTDPLADCQLTVQWAGNSIQRSTWANGQGELFWLITLPDDVPPGAIEAYATCGAAPGYIRITVP
jgi:hypothetical protein